jgi:dsDNA-binding SOS-regulon protein
MSWIELTRVRNVSMMKQHGQVTLEGKIDQVTIFMQRERERLERILKTKRYI